MEDNNITNTTSENVEPAVEAGKTENLSKEELKRIEREKTRREKREWNERRRIKRGKKALRGRKIKNLLFFITGFFSSIILLVSGILVGAKFIPLKTFFGENSEIIKSDTAGEKSAVDLVLNLKDYQISDVPVLANLLESLVTGSGMSDILTIDTAKLKETHFDNIGQGILGSAKISKNLFGSLADLEMFETVEVPVDEIPADDEFINPDSPNYDGESNRYKLYYYLKEEGGFATYERAYNDDRTRVEDSEGKQLYYLSLAEMNVNDMKDLFSERFKLLKVKSIFKTLADVEDDNFINDVLGDRNISGLANFDKSDIKIESVLGEYEEDKNGKLYKLIWDASRYEEDDITGDITYETPDYPSLTLADLSGEKFNVDMVRLTTVLGNPETSEKQKLYELIWDASRYTGDPLNPYEEVPLIPDPDSPGDYIKDYSSLNLKDLSGDGFNIDMVRLKTVINSDTGNKVIDKLRTDDTVTLDNIGEKANALTLVDILDVEPMKEVDGLTVNCERDCALYTLNSDGITYQLVAGSFSEGTKKYSYTGLNLSTKYYEVNSEAGVWFLPLTTLSDSGEPYDNTKSEWGAYGTIVAGVGCTLGDLSELTVDISVVKMKVLKDLGLLSAADPSAAAYNVTLTYLLTLVS